MNCVSEVHRRARLQLKHVCFACLLPIVAGDDYVKFTYAFDGRVYSLNIHRICTEALLPGIVEPGEELNQAYLIHYFDPEHDTTPEWRAWYRQRLEAAP
jgi:hypothetical protein